MAIKTTPLTFSFCQAIREAYESPSKSKIVVLDSNSGIYAAVPKPRFGFYSSGNQPVDIKSIQIDHKKLTNSVASLSDEDLLTLEAAFRHFGREDIAKEIDDFKELRELECELEVEEMMEEAATTNSTNSSPAPIHPVPFLEVLDSKTTTDGITLDELTEGERSYIESYVTNYYHSSIDMEWGDEHVCVEDPNTSELMLFSYQELVER